MCFWSIWRHKYYVYLGSREVGDVPLLRVLCHDLSKFHPREFFGYANKFYGADDNQDLFDRAWLHHQNSCSHHWEYWILRAAHKKQGTIPQGFMYLMEMPEACVREMVSDWVGASIVYGGTTDMTGWLRENLHKIEVHPKTGRLIVEILKDMGYKDAWTWFRGGE